MNHSADADDSDVTGSDEVTERSQGISAEEVAAIVDHLESSGVTYQVNGGWGVDALVGRQTREHSDVDVFVDGLAFEQVADWLLARGYVEEQDFMPVATWFVQVTEDRINRVDLHPMVLDDDGNGYQSGELDRYFHHRADQRTTGTIAGRPVVVGNREHLVSLRKGYPPRPVDLHDLIELEKLRGLEVGRVDLPGHTD
ncbi:nucleotidyltransferase domain-containing protein [Aestuariimicrobium kwangyangense]|uniref:nucleotidyltransferase domain-containing protein n=1 Tax=Aestuariimicrobium kwangyangense TaxID=396389 RepID=UPI0003B602BB|nr:lincomycin resistance protein LmrB [Aestuariimicrobium kwangyangense]